MSRWSRRGYRRRLESARGSERSIEVPNWLLVRLARESPKSRAERRRLRRELLRGVGV